MAKNRRYTFLTKPESEGGLSSLVFGILGVILTVADVIISAVYAGNAGTTAGVIGIGAFLFGMCGFFFGLLGLRVRNVSHRKAYIGVIAGGLVIIVWLALLIRSLK